MARKLEQLTVTACGELSIRKNLETVNVTREAASNLTDAGESVKQSLINRVC